MVLKYSKTIRQRKEVAQKLSVSERLALKKRLFEAVYVSNIARLGEKVKLWIFVDSDVVRRTGGGLAMRQGWSGKMLLDRGEKVCYNGK